MKIAEILYRLGKRLRRKKEKVADPKIEKGHSPSNRIEAVSENRILFSGSSVTDSEGTEDYKSNRTTGVPE